jgi:hypothetical protein
LQKNCPCTQRQVVIPYMHGMFAGVEHAVPGGGWAEGQGALQCQVSPPMPPKHVQLVSP